MNDGKGGIWKTLQFFWGKWNGVMEGKGLDVKREYHIIMDGKYVYIRNMSLTKERIIEFKDIGIMSHDRINDRYILRVYSSEGRVFEFLLKNAENGRIVWETTNIENLPGHQAKVEEVITGKREFDETFYMKKDDGDYKVHMRTHFKK